MTYTNNYATIAEPLFYVSNKDRETWVRMGMAVKSELGNDGWDVWRDWSATAPNYNEKAAIAAWKSFKPTGGVTIASLFYEAEAGGWKPEVPYTPPSFSIDAWILRQQQGKAAARKTEDIQADVAKQAFDLWRGSDGPAIASHAYCKRKHINPKGARHAGGTLLIPMYDQGHNLVSLQEIDGNGRKLFLKGGKVKDCYGLVCDHGDRCTPFFSITEGEVMLCEGWATACTLHAKHKLPVFVAFTAGNLPAIAKFLDSVLRCEVTKMWVAGDVDESGTGQKAATAAMENIHFREKELMLPVFTTEQKTAFAASHKGKPPSDFNDLDCIERGLV